MMLDAKTHVSFSRVNAADPSYDTVARFVASSQSGLGISMGKVMLAIAMGSTIGTRRSLYTTPRGNLNGAGVTSAVRCLGAASGGIEPRYFSTIARTRRSSNAPTNATVNSDGSA